MALETRNRPPDRAETPAEDPTVDVGPALQDHSQKSSMSNEETDSSVMSGLSSSSEAWYNDPMFGRYWKHYSKVRSWFEKHKEVMRKQQERELVNCWQEYWQRWYQLMNSGVYPYFMNPYNPWSYCSQYYDMNYFYNTPEGDRTAHSPRFYSHGSSIGTPQATKPSHVLPGKTVSKKKRKWHQKQKKLRAHKRRNCSVTRSEDLSNHLLDSSADHEKSEGHSEEEEFHIEITDEMLKFFAQSMKYKEEKEAKKKEEKETKEDEYVNLSEVTVSSSQRKTTVLPPSEQPGAKRTAEMKLLYGAGAAMIQGMETAMQLTFDRNCDIHQMKLWPALPLNIKFD